MSISKKKSPVNRKNTPKAYGKHAVTKKIIRFKEIEHEMTTAQPVILSSEDKKNFKELSENAKNSFNPQNEVEKTLVNQIVYSLWKLERLEVIMQGVYKDYTDMDGRTLCGICQWKLDTLLNNLDSKCRVDICFG